MTAETYILLIAGIVGIAGIVAFAMSRRPRKPKAAPEPAATHEELQEFVRALVKEIELAIALCSLSRNFSGDERIEDTYENTYEAHGFVMCRSSLDSSLVLAIMRCHDHRPDSHGLTAFFNLLNDETTKANLREGILQRRRQWVTEQEAQQETHEHLEEIETARQQEAALKGTHQYDRVRNFRHTQVAHNAISPKSVQPTHREYLYELTDMSRDIVQMLSGAVLGEGQGFSMHAEIWEDTYARAFFDTMFERAAD